MATINREYAEAVYRVFQEFALNDQRSYYKFKVKRNRDAGASVNRWRAAFAFLAGLASAASGFVVSNQLAAGVQCGSIPSPGGACDLLPWFAVIAVIAPTVGAAFGTLADLYQWDRLVTIYEAALENLEVADAQSPHADMKDDTYWLAVRAFAEGTLDVMRDETAQWGTLIRTPESLERFIEQAQARAARLSGGGDASSGGGGG